MKYEALVKDAMRKDIVYVKPKTSVKEIAEIMSQMKVGSVLVKDDKIIGIVTKSDIINRYVAQKKGDTAEDIMTKTLITISENKTLEDAAKLMVEKEIERLLVKSKNKIVGLISTVDILKIEPELYKNLLEALKMKSGPIYKEESTFGECERCGNFSDDLKEVNGMWICEECRKEIGFEGG